MRSSSTIIAGALLGALLTAALTGCTTNGPTDPEPAVTAVATAAAEPTPEPTPAPAPGDVIDVADKDAIPAGLLPYRLDGRDIVVLDPAAPLPQGVLDDVTARADAGPTGNFVAAIVGIEADTGKRFATVDLAFGTLNPGEEARDIWSVYTSGGSIGVDLGSREAAVAAADAYVASQPDPSQWIVLTVD